MKYIPSKMISKSRFSDYAKALDAKRHGILEKILSRLIKENSEYADKKNYGHLCNLLMSLAIVLMLEETGKTREEGIQTAANAMYEYIKLQKRVMEKIVAHKWFVPMLKVTMPTKFKRTLGYGWKVEFPRTSVKEFKMVTHECVYAKIFAKYGMPEMTAVFCKVDDILYGELPQTDFEYTQQIGTGGRMCDYTFRRK